jgi:hypothetical protein
MCLFGMDWKTVRSAMASSFAVDCGGLPVPEICC